MPAKKLPAEHGHGAPNGPHNGSQEPPRKGPQGAPRGLNGPRGPRDPRSPELSVVDRIKEYILLGRLAPGDPMPTENELSEQLAVSRSRIREAMKTLSALDIVEVRHGYGTYVGRLSLTAMVESLAFRGLLNAQDDQDVMADLIDVRELIETSLAEVVVENTTPEMLESMRQLTRTMHEKAARGEEFLAEDREFHLLLMRTTGNALAVQLTGAFWDVHAIALGALPGTTDLAQTADAHVAVLDAIGAGDSALLRKAIVRHYAPIRERMGHRAPQGGATAD
ncbi:FadR/GntR family transcriptional regulator [Streptomyces marispadix]|uniref:FadR family transcriptional regulator n=1 Tax=Streptomyces marispadix TaxID=2922868 RepID=A0ABS9SZ48_9ACTN|nr:FadR/GntR family transcriptional regulator [Streptomyces marispadix]MCH6161316.1 FadR family transcriptional regulator [Streptomyces marispadix]